MNVLAVFLCAGVLIVYLLVGLTLASMTRRFRESLCFGRYFFGEGETMAVSPSNKKRETETTKEMLQVLEKAGFYVWRNNSGVMVIGSRFVRFGKAGSSDIIGWTPYGQFIAIENKTNGEPIKESQQEFIDALNSRGGFGIIAMSVEDVIDFVESGIWRK